MIDFKKVNLTPTILSISSDICDANGKIFIVGGWVRDILLFRDTKDMDFEVYGLSYDKLLKVLKKYGKADIVGKHFGVINFKTASSSYDFALPRKESKVGVGHKDFNIECGDLDFKQASRRRDFTINSMGVLIPSMRFFDPYGGYEDLRKGVIRHVSESFTDDHLRALRAVQLAARLNFSLDKDTLNLCRKLNLQNLSKERIFSELNKLLLQSQKPSIGLKLMEEMNILDFFPELKALVGLKQDPLWHPEGDVWTHTNMVVDEQVKLLTGNLKDDRELIYAALCHDLGKAKTTIISNGSIRCPLHELQGEALTRSFLGRLTDEKEFTDNVVSLVREHMKPWQLYQDKERLSDAAIRRLSIRVDIKKLVRLAEADCRGKGKGLNGEFKAGAWLLERSKNLKVLDHKPKPLLTGKMLIKIGYKEGPSIGKLIKKSFKLQIDGKINTKEEALSWARDKMKY